jgi:16S rRNA (cytosine1402-N4)-methyltransferase
MATTRHIPVLPRQVLQGLEVQPGQVVVDATVGGGGHALLLAERLGAQGHLIALDRDAAALERARGRLESLSPGPRITLIQSNFDRLRQVLDHLRIEHVDAVLADLGFSSDQIESAERGMSFQLVGPLDMRMNRDDEQTAADILASWNERDLADLFWQLGEERFSRRIARAVMQRREDQPLETTQDLAELVRGCVPKNPRGIDPATRVFQALRIAVNDELGSLKRMLESLPRCLRLGGRAAVISFHSLEDRLVKRALKDKTHWQALTKKPLVADDEEEAGNPRSRSAKLRIAQLVHI